MSPGAALDLAILAAFVLYSTAAGLRARRLASRSLEDYFLAGRSLPGWKAGCSMAATQFAADTPLLVTGLLATGGVFLLWRLWIYGIAFLLLGFLFAGPWRRAAVLTDAELTEIRYGGRGVLLLRIAKAVYFGTIVNSVVLAMVLFAALRIADVFLPWHEWLPDPVHGALVDLVRAAGLALGEPTTALDGDVATVNRLTSLVLVLAFVALYSTTGGLHAVVATDVAQLGMALVGSAVYAGILLAKLGGPGAVAERIALAYGAARTESLLSFAPPAGDLLLPFATIVGLQWLFQMNADGSGYLAQRSMACASERDARIAAVVFAVTQIVVRSVLWLVIGLALIAVYEPSVGTEEPAAIAAREALFVRGIGDHLPPGVRGLLVVSLLAALASTIDTHLNWGASYWTNDLYGRLVCRAWLRREARPRELVLVARLSVVVVLGCAMAVMAELGSIQQAWRISLLFGAGSGFVLVARWLWERMNLWSELGAMAASLALAPLLLVTIESDAGQLAGIALGSTLAALLGARLGPETPAEIRVSFFRRVRPPGFWRETALAAGADPEDPVRVLGRAAAASAAAAASLFLALYGIGRLVTAPEGAAAITVIPLLGAAALVPLWWRALRAE
jgi:solute:Na+ symporter, SSS family